MMLDESPENDPLAPLGLGTWQLLGARCQSVVEEALELGYRSIDTAQAYNNESEVGAAIAVSGVPRDEVFITTKVWPDHLVADPDGTVDASLARLRVASVDLLLLHWPSPTCSVEEAAEALGVALDRGVARYVGVSNYPAAYLERALERVPVACNQIELHPFLGQRRLLRRAAELGVQIAAYSPLARGRVARDPVLVRLGRRHGKTAAQVTLRWLVQKPGVAALPKASTRARLAENMDIFDFELGESEVAAIDALARGERLIDLDFGPEFAVPWDPEDD